MKIGGFDPLDIAKNVGSSIAQDALKKADPLNLFGGDSMTKGGSGRANGVGGTGGIEDILAALGSKKDKNNSFDTSGVSDNLFKGGTNSGNSDSGSGAGGGGAGGGMQQMMGQIMGLVKQILPMVMGMLGGL